MTQLCLVLPIGQHGWIWGLMGSHFDLYSFGSRVKAKVEPTKT